MKKIDFIVPKGINYLSQWANFESNIPSCYNKIILNKGICGCGCTEYFLNNDKPVILVSPRKELINSKMIAPRDRPLFYFDRSSYKTVSVSQSINDLEYYIMNKMEVTGFVPKILVTYDSFNIVAEFLEQKGVLNQFTIIVDEFTSIFTDVKLKGNTELKFINTLNKLDNKTIFISATPLQDIYLDEIDEFKDMLYVTLFWNDSMYERINIYKYRMNSERESIGRIIEQFRKDGFFQKKELNGLTVYSNEAVFFLNSVNDIISIIKKKGLTENDTRVICADNKENVKALKSVDFSIAHVPGINDYKTDNKTFTFVTKASFEGTDFYSDCSTTYIFANPNKDHLALDISIDISQIIGRCRTKSNPFRKDIMFFYKTSNNSAEEIHAYIDKIQEKINRTRTTMANLIGINDMNLISKLKTAQKIDQYRYDYIDIVEENDTSSIAFNKLALVADTRAAEIKSLQYRNIFTVSDNLKQKYNIIDYAPTVNENLQEFYSNFMKDCNFARRMQLYCETLEIKPEYKESLEVIREVPDIIKDAYNIIGPVKAKALGYKETAIAEEISRFQSDDTIAHILRNKLKYYSFYNNKDLKNIIAETYRQVGLECNAKASDITKYFSHYKKVKIRENKERILGYKFGMSVSVFNNIQDTKGGTTYDVKEVLHIIKHGDKDGKIKRQINEIRKNSSDKKARNELKKQLPVIMWQGIFSSRCNSGITELSSLVCIDIDKKNDNEILDLWNSLMNDRFVFAMFHSPSGDGLKILIKTDNYDIDAYKNIYKQVEEYFKSKYNIETDNNCEPISQGCYASYDPDLYVNLNADSIHFDISKCHKAQTVQKKIKTQSAAPLSKAYTFMSKLKSTVPGLKDENIIFILDRRFRQYPQNYQDGYRTKAIFAQASELCKAGVSIENAISYLKECFLPTGYNEGKLVYEANRGYTKNELSFGINRQNFLSYNEYKNRQNP